MRTPFVVILMILAVPLMGSNCYFAARSGGSPPRPPGDGTNPPPASGGGGGVIIVGSNSTVTGASTEESARIERSYVESALAVSVWTPPDFERTAASTEHFDPTSIELAEWEGGAAAPGETPTRSTSAPVPEPTGLVLFASGLWVASRVGRACAGLDVQAPRGRDGTTQCRRADEDESEDHGA